MSKTHGLRAPGFVINSVIVLQLLAAACSELPVANTVRPPVTPTKLSTKSESWNDIVSNVQDLPKYLKVLEPEFANGLVCIKNQGVENYAASYCRQIDLAKYHPFGQAHKGMDDFVQVKLNKLNNGEFSDPVDKAFERYLRLADLDCRANQRKVEELVKSEGSEMVTWQMLYTQYDGKPVSPLQAETADPEQAALMVLQPVFGLGTEYFNFTNERRSIEIDPSPFLKSKNWDVKTKEKVLAVAEKSKRLQSKIALLRSKLLRSNPGLLSAALFSMANTTDYSWDNLPNAMALDSKDIPESYREAYNRWKAGRLAIINVEYGRLDESFKLWKRWDAKLRGSDGKILKWSNETFSWIFEALLKGDDGFKIKSQNLSQIYPKRFQDVQWETDDRELVQRWKVIKSDAPVLSLSDLVNQGVVSKEEADRAESIAPEFQTMFQNLNQVMKSALLGSKEVIEQVQAINKDSFDLQKDIEALGKDIFENGDAAKYYALKWSGTALSCDQVRESLLKKYAENWVVADFYESPFYQNRKNNFVTEARNLVIERVKKSNISEAGKMNLIEGITSAKQDKDLVFLKSDLEANFKKSDLAFQDLIQKHGFTQAQAAGAVMKAFKGTASNEQFLAANAYWGKRGKNENVYDIFPPYLPVEFEHEAKSAILLTLSHEMGHGLNRMSNHIYGENGWQSIIDAKTSDAFAKVRSCHFEMTGGNFLRWSEDFADMIGVEALILKLEASPSDSALRLQIIKQLLSHLCFQTPSEDRDAHSSPWTRAKIMAQNPRLWKLLFGNIPQPEFLKNYRDCGALF